MKGFLPSDAEIEKASNNPVLDSMMAQFMADQYNNEQDISPVATNPNAIDLPTATSEQTINEINSRNASDKLLKEAKDKEVLDAWKNRFDPKAVKNTEEYEKVLTAPGRALASLPALVPGGKSYYDALKMKPSDTESKVGSWLRSPDAAGVIWGLGAGLATGGLATEAGAPVALRYGLPALAATGTDMLANAATTKSPKEFWTNSGLDLAGNAVLPGLGAGVRRVAKGAVARKLGSILAKQGIVGSAADDVIDLAKKMDFPLSTKQGLKQAQRSTVGTANKLNKYIEGDKAYLINDAYTQARRRLNKLNSNIPEYADILDDAGNVVIPANENKVWKSLFDIDEDLNSDIVAIKNSVSPDEWKKIKARIATRDLQKSMGMPELDVYKGYGGEDVDDIIFRLDNAATKINTPPSDILNSVDKIDTYMGDDVNRIINVTAPGVNEVLKAHKGALWSEFVNLDELNNNIIEDLYKNAKDAGTFVTPGQLDATNKMINSLKNIAAQNNLDVPVGGRDGVYLPVHYLFQARNNLEKLYSGPYRRPEGGPALNSVLSSLDNAINRIVGTKPGKYNVNIPEYASQVLPKLNKTSNDLTAVRTLRNALYEIANKGQKYPYPYTTAYPDIPKQSSGIIKSTLGLVPKAIKGTAQGVLDYGTKPGGSSAISGSIGNAFTQALERAIFQGEDNGQR